MGHVYTEMPGSQAAADPTALLVLGDFHPFPFAGFIFG